MKVSLTVTWQAGSTLLGATTILGAETSLTASKGSAGMCCHLWRSCIECYYPLRFCSISRHLWRHYSGPCHLGQFSGGVRSPNTQKGDPHQGKCVRRGNQFWNIGLKGIGTGLGIPAARTDTSGASLTLDIRPGNSRDWPYISGLDRPWQFRCAVARLGLKSFDVGDAGLMSRDVRVILAEELWAGWAPDDQQWLWCGSGCSAETWRDSGWSALTWSDSGWSAVTWSDSGWSAVTWSDLAGQLWRGLTLAGQLWRAVTLAGELRRAVTLAGELRRAVTLAGELRRAVTLAGELRRAVTLAESWDVQWLWLESWDVLWLWLESWDVLWLWLESWDVLWLWLESWDVLWLWLESWDVLWLVTINCG